MKLKSPIRWAGSKYSIVGNLIKYVPQEYNTYIEPMFGSGALFLSLQPQKAVINDKNSDLIAFIEVLKKHGDLLIKDLLNLSSSKKLYYELRESQPVNRYERAIRFLYLNRLCWNGVYRVNKDGRFNVPIGDRLPKKLWEEKVLRSFQKLLNNTTVLNYDFEEIFQFINSNDFVYFDPPYPKNSSNKLGFNRYVTEFFTMDDHARLGKFIESISYSHVKVMLTLGDNNEILAQYPKFLKRIGINSKSLISCNDINRGAIKEFILINY